MTTGKMYFYDRPDVFWCAGGRFQPWLGYRTRHDGEYRKILVNSISLRRVTYTPTCCLLVRRSVFDRIGLMDSRYYVYSDDVDFIYRCLQAWIDALVRAGGKTLAQSQFPDRRRCLSLCYPLSDTKCDIFSTQAPARLACPLLVLLHADTFAFRLFARTQYKIKVEPSANGSEGWTGNRGKIRSSRPCFLRKLSDSVYNTVRWALCPFSI